MVEEMDSAHLLKTFLEECVKIWGQLKHMENVTI